MEESSGRLRSCHSIFLLSFQGIKPDLSPCACPAGFLPKLLLSCAFTCFPHPTLCAQPFPSFPFQLLISETGNKGEQLAYGETCWPEAKISLQGARLYLNFGSFLSFTRKERQKPAQLAKEESACWKNRLFFPHLNFIKLTQNQARIWNLSNSDCKK